MQAVFVGVGLVLLMVPVVQAWNDETHRASMSGRVCGLFASGFMLVANVLNDSHPFYLVVCGLGVLLWGFLIAVEINERQVHG